MAALEASPDDVPGRRFDFQVHLRSGAVGGLLDQADVRDAFRGTSAERVDEVSYFDGADPFQRSYRLTMASYSTHRNVEAER